MGAIRPHSRHDLDALAGAFDPTRIGDAIDDWCAARGLAERTARVDLRRVFYVPDGECSIVYDLVLQRNGDSATQMLTARPCDELWGERWAGKAERKTRNGKFATPALGAPAYYLRDLGVIAWTFPNDPDLKPLAVHAQRPAREIIAQLAAITGRAEWTFGNVARSTVRYIPGKRCVFRYDLDGDGGGDPMTLYAKIYEDASPARDAHAVLDALWRAARADSGMLRIPEPLALDADAWTTYQRALSGDAMVAQAATVTPADAAAIGRALARMHLLRLPVRTTHRLEDEYAKARSRAQAVATMHPGVRSRLDEVLQRLGTALPRLSRLPLVPSHGTFKLAHLLREGSHIGVVDFDSFVQADPVYDIANFVADLHYLEAAGLLPHGRAARLGAALYDAWCAQVPWGRRDAVLDWYVAALLIRKQAMKCVKHLHADAAVKIDAVLAVAERRSAALV